ncbi:hypothetical protein RD792_008902 [Penstemon davidsonii]|uniref:Cytochrome P450 n=1 Tax=Penstemon davidsonii TaxID=160366 RepID=A0ABR0DAE8_9LAMI|nr:hypothetical protein RD792_008902 [Penstemon davidsonii]
MDVITAVMLVLLLLVLAWSYVLGSNSSRHRGKLAPGPYPFPIIGNIFQLGRKPHQSLAKLSETYGPLMSLQLGSIYTVVVSSPEITKEVLQKHDHVLSGRTIGAAAQVHNHHNISMAYLPVGNQWRKIRKICKEQMFSNPRLDAGRSLRQEKLKELCDYVRECCVKGRAVDIGEAAFITSLNLMSATLYSEDFTSFNSESTTHEWREIIRGVVKTVGVPNVADFFPVLKRFDPQGITKEAEFYFGKLLEMFEDVVKQRLHSRKITSPNPPPKKNDMLEALLDLGEGSEDAFFSSNHIKHLLLDLFIAGSHTTSSTVEWAITELLLNPTKMSRAKNELRTVVGENKQVEESDISTLPYLQAVIKEILRFHPAGPLLIPHKSEADVEINGYTIPKNTQILVNVWAMGRQSNLWSSPNSFEPERFLDNKVVDFKGQYFEYIPFGSGRRICPGLPLANRMLHILVASLIQNFDWELEPGTKPEDVDTTEKFGLALHKAVPLKALPVKLTTFQP